MSLDARVKQMSEECGVDVTPDGSSDDTDVNTHTHTTLAKMILFFSKCAFVRFVFTILYSF